MIITFIVVRIKDNVSVIFEDDFIGNAFRTQNQIIQVLRLFYDEKDFSVDLRTVKLKEIYRKEK